MAKGSDCHIGCADQILFGRLNMKYLEKSFTLPTTNRQFTAEEWDAIWNPSKEGVAFTATESEYPVTDTVALGAMMLKAPFTQCPNCHCEFNSYRHIETCVELLESD